MEKRYTLFALFMLQFLSVFEMAVVMPLGPIIADRFSVEYKLIPLMSIGFVSMGLFAPFFGRLSSRFGLRRILMINGYLYIIGAVGIIFSTHIFGFVFFRMIIGISYAVMIALIPAFLVKIVPSHRLGFMTGILKISFSGAIFLSASLGTFIVYQFGLEYLYGVLALSMCLCTLLLTRVQDQKEVDRKPVKEFVFHIKGIPIFLVLAFLASMPIIFVSNFYSIHLSLIGIAREQISIYYSIMGLGSILSAAAIIIFSKYIGRISMALFALYFIVFGLIGIRLSVVGILQVALLLFYLGVDTYSGLIYVIAGKKYSENRNQVLTTMSMFSSMGMAGSMLISPITFKYLGFNGHIYITIAILVLMISFFKSVFKEQLIK